MLSAGAYKNLSRRPAITAARRLRRGRHLSDAESADLLRKASRRRLRWACLGHLSEENSTPHPATKAHRSIVGAALPLHVAGRYAATDVMDV